MERRQLLTAVTASEFRFNDLATPQSTIVDFDANVSASLTLDDLVLYNLTTGGSIDRADLALAFNTATNRATLTVPGESNLQVSGALPDANYELILAAEGITDSLGGALADDHTLAFFFKMADANRDRQVDIADQAILNANYNSSGKTFSQGDFTYDGMVNIADFSKLSALFNTHLPAPPDAPYTLSTGNQTADSIQLTWTPPATGTPDGFRLYRSTDGVNFGDPIATIPFDGEASVYSYTDTGLLDGTKYWHRVRAYTVAEGNSSATNKDWAVTVLPAPTSLAAAATPDGYVDVTWTDNSTNATVFTIERSIGTTGVWAEVGSSPNGTTLWRDWYADEGVTYLYRVTARTPADEAVSGSPSSSAYTTPSVFLPNDLSASVTTDSITLTWVDRSDVETGYRVQRATDSSFSQGLVTYDLDAGEQKFEQHGIAENTTFFYRVAPNTSGGAGTYQTFDAGTTTLLAGPSNLQTEVLQNGDVKLTWGDQSSIESGYRVERADDMDFTTGLTVLGTTTANANEFTYQGVSPTGEYHYRVVTVTGGGVESVSGSSVQRPDGTAARPGNPVIRPLGETLWTGTYDENGNERVLYGVRPGQPIFFSVRTATFQSGTFNNSSNQLSGWAGWATVSNSVMNTEHEYNHSRLTWHFGDSGSSHNELPGYTAGHVYATEGLYPVKLTVTYPDAAQTTKVLKVFVQVTQDSAAQSGSTTVANSASIADVTYRDIYIGGGNPNGSGDTGLDHAHRVTFGRAVTIFNGLTTKTNVRLYFRADQENPINQPGTTTQFNFSGATNVVVSQYRANSTYPRARVTLNRSSGINEQDGALWKFGESTRFVSVSGIEFSVDGTEIANKGRVAAIVGKNVSFRDVKLTKIHYPFEVGSGIVSGTQQNPSYKQAEGVLLQNVNARKMQNATSGALVNVTYDDPSIVTGRYFLFANPPTRGLVVLGSKSGETTLAANGKPKDHVTRTYASDVLMYGNTFTNRAALVSGSTTEVASEDKNVYTLRANQGRFIYWSNNTTYAGSMLLGRVKNDSLHHTMLVQHVIIERNRILQDQRDISGVNRDSFIYRFQFTNENSEPFGEKQTALVSNVVIRNNVFTNPRGLSGDSASSVRLRHSIIEGPHSKGYFLHNTFVHNQNEDKTASPQIWNHPWVRLHNQINNTSSVDVFRGNLFVSQQSAAPGSGSSSESTQVVLDIPRYSYSQIQAGGNQFANGQVEDNVFPVAPLRTAYRARFVNDSRSISGTNSWTSIFSGDRQLPVSLQSDFAPTTSNVDDASNLSIPFGVYDDLYGNERPSTGDSWTVGAVQR